MNPEGIKQCRRDIEQEIAHLTKKLLVFKSFQQGIVGFLEYGNSHWFDSQEVALHFLAAVGSLSIEIPIMERNLESLIAELEEEKSK